MAMIAKVVVRLMLDRVFDYLVPEELLPHMRPGIPVVVPFGRSVRSGYVVELSDHSDRTDLKSILAVPGHVAGIPDSLMKLARWMADYYVAPIEAAVHTVLPAAVRHGGARALARQKVILVQTPPPEEEARMSRRAPSRFAVLNALREAHGEAWLSHLAKVHPGAPQAVRALAKKGWVQVVTSERERRPEQESALVRSEPLPLMPQQAQALQVIRNSMDTGHPRVVLLFGVTGSGKTEIYLQAIGHVLSHGRGAIVLVPEIALTPQTCDRFRSRFGDTVAVLHSHLSDGERRDEWFRIHRGDARIVIGARSALFAPVRDLGLIVVDEEHEATYKQDELPRYHARDVAVMRGHLDGASVVLGSATPSLESWYNAQIGKYALVHLPHRVDHRAMPVIRIVDMRAEMARTGRPVAFSKDLLQAISQRLSAGEQIILFLNRRGYSTSLICLRCGHVVRCEQCSVPMVYHRDRQQVVCHLCGSAAAAPEECPNRECREPGIRYHGIGTERVEDLLRKFFPGARVARMDSDTMVRKHEYRRVLGEFRAGKLDVLIGTQMIAKGLDFPNVTLVGVVHADVGLHLPDFRAGERTFQLLVQVAGRAGRGDVAGEVIVQTYTPYHAAIQAAQRLDWQTFYQQELAFRKELGYPPVTHMVAITVQGEDEASVAETAGKLAAQLRLGMGHDATVAEPAPAPLQRVRKAYRYQVMIRTPAILSVLPRLRATWRHFDWPRGVKGLLDVDPVSLL